MTRPDLVQRTEFLLAAAAGKRVLHLGCTNYPYTDITVADGSLLHLKLSRVCAELYGFDFDQEGIDALGKHGFNGLFRADLEHLSEVPLDLKFDVIIAGEVIEHLSNPGLFLRGIQRFMGPETKLIMTTINAYCAMRFVQYALRGRGGIAEPVHPDHVSYYSYKTLRLVAERAGLQVDGFHFYDLGSEHRPYNPVWYNIVNDVAVAFSKQLSDGIIAVCRLKS